MSKVSSPRIAQLRLARVSTLNLCAPNGQSQCFAEPHLAACAGVSDCGSGGGSNGTEVENKIPASYA